MAILQTKKLLTENVLRFVRGGWIKRGDDLSRSRYLLVYFPEVKV